MFVVETSERIGPIIPGVCVTAETITLINLIIINFILRPILRPSVRSWMGTRYSDQKAKPDTNHCLAVRGRAQPDLSAQHLPSQEPRCPRPLLQPRHPIQARSGTQREEHIQRTCTTYSLYKLHCHKRAEWSGYVGGLWFLRDMPLD